MSICTICTAKYDGPRPERTTKARSHFRAAYCILAAKVSSQGRYLKEGPRLRQGVLSTLNVEQVPRGSVRANYGQPALPKTRTLDGVVREGSRPVLYETKVTTPRVPPPPSQRAQNRSWLLYALALTARLWPSVVSLRYIGDLRNDYVSTTLSQG